MSREASPEEKKANGVILNKEKFGLMHVSCREDGWDVDLEFISLYVKGVFAYDLFIHSGN